MAREQVLVQLTPELKAALDQHAAAEGRSRSDVIRRALEGYLAELVEGGIAERYADAYKRFPQEPDPFAEWLAVQSIRAEPW